MRYRKKPVEIEAEQWPDDGDTSYDALCQRAKIHRWIKDNGGKTQVVNHMGDIYSAIITLEGEMRISSGDFVIRGVQGEFYPCKPDIFEATYEPVTE